MTTMKPIEVSMLGLRWCVNAKSSLLVSPPSSRDPVSEIVCLTVASVFHYISRLAVALWKEYWQDKPHVHGNVREDLQT